MYSRYNCCNLDNFGEKVSDLFLFLYFYSAVSSKRPAWDYKGRLQDMEGALSDFVAKNEETTRQVARLMAERQELQGEIAVKTEITTKTSQEITQLETKIR